MFRRPLKYITPREAVDIDAELMGDQGFSIDQLMELAGLSCASAIEYLYPISAYPRPLIICGPGNNGGDGLVAARHLRHFGYFPEILYPKAPQKPLYQRLVKQCKSLDIPVHINHKSINFDTYSILVDAIFGFSFEAGSIRDPYDSVLHEITKLQSAMPLVSLDVPSGWCVEKGDVGMLPFGLRPETLISLTAPKECAKYFTGKHHAIGGRFVSPAMADKYALFQGTYVGSAQFVMLS